MSWLRLRGVVLVAIAAAFWPLSVMSANLVGVVRPERVIAIVALVWLIGVLLIRLFSFFGMRSEAAENTAFLVVVLIMNAGPLIREIGGLAYPALIAAAILAAFLFQRLSESIVVSALVWGLAVALAAGPTISILRSLGSQGTSVVVEAEPISVNLDATPDVFLVVFDGYPGAIAASQDGLGDGVVDMEAELVERGFRVPKSSWASYWTTTLSVSSLMEMRYPVQEPFSGSATVRDLQEILSGGSAFVEVLEANGYRTVMVESGWSGATCGEGFHDCVPAPLLDEATYLILRQTIAWAFLESSPGPYTEGTLAAFDWLITEGSALGSSEAPDFVFVHVVAPHHPYFLDPSCEVELEGLGLVDQIDCMDTFMVTFADLVGPDDILIFVSDHGTDGRGQLDPEKAWTEEATVERLNNIVAARLPAPCEIKDEVIVPELLRLVLGCLSGTDIDPIERRMWANPMVELAPNYVDQLVSMRPGK